MARERSWLVVGLVLASSSCASTVLVEEAEDGGGSGPGAATSAADGGSNDASASGAGGEDGAGGAGGAAPPPVDAPSVVDALCPQVAAESIVCIGVVNGRHVSAIGLDTGVACRLRSVDVGPYEVSIAAVGTDVLYCDAYGIVRAPLMGGETEHIGVDCGGIFNFRDGIAHAPQLYGPDVVFYDSVSDLAAGNPTGSTQLSIGAASYASFGETIWITEQIATAIYGFVPPDSAPAETVPLGDDLGAVQGLAVVDQDTIVFGHPFGIRLIDRWSGVLVREVDIVGDEEVFDGPLGTPTGLSCYRP